jgi:hypothetical protein
MFASRRGKKADDLDPRSDRRSRLLLPVRMTPVVGSVVVVAEAGESQRPLAAPPPLVPPIDGGGRTSLVFSVQIHRKTAAEHALRKPFFLPET